MSALTLRIPPLAIVAASALLIWLIAQAVPALSFHFRGSVWAASICATLGVIATVAGVAAFRRARTTVNPLAPEQASAVVTSGVYRLSRNPMYLGFLLLLLGWALYLGNAASFIVLPLYVFYMNRYQIGPEEAALAAKFGEPYLAYQRRVRRWI